jgi:hypothetical protein
MKGYLFDQAFYSGEDGDAAQHARIAKRVTVADKTTRRCATRVPLVMISAACGAFLIQG